MPLFQNVLDTVTNIIWGESHFSFMYHEFRLLKTSSVKDKNCNYFLKHLYPQPHPHLSIHTPNYSYTYTSTHTHTHTRVLWKQWNSATFVLGNLHRLIIHDRYNISLFYVCQCEVFQRITYKQICYTVIIYAIFCLKERVTLSIDFDYSTQHFVVQLHYICVCVCAT